MFAAHSSLAGADLQRASISGVRTPPSQSGGCLTAALVRLDLPVAWLVVGEQWPAAGVTLPVVPSKQTMIRLFQLAVVDLGSVATLD